MTTDRDTLLAVNDILHRSFVAGRRTYAHQFAKAQSEIIELIDAHDNALKEQLMAGKIAIYEDGGDNKRSFPAIPVTHIIEVFSKGETDE